MKKLSSRKSSSASSDIKTSLNRVTHYEENKNSSLNIISKKLLVTEAMKHLIEDKSEKLFNLNIKHIHVSLAKSKSSFSVNITASAGKEIFKGSAEHGNAYTAIIEAFHIVTEKTHRSWKRKNHRMRHRAKGSVLENRILSKEKADQDELFMTTPPIDDGFTYLKMTGRLSPHHKIVSREKMKIKIFTQEEAILHMETESDPALLFLGEEDKKIKLIYRTENGNYGILESERCFSES